MKNCYPAKHFELCPQLLACQDSGDLFIRRGLARMGRSPYPQPSWNPQPPEPQSGATPSTEVQTGLSWLSNAILTSIFAMAIHGHLSVWLHDWLHLSESGLLSDDAHRHTRRGRHTKGKPEVSNLGTRGEFSLSATHYANTISDPDSNPLHFGADFF